MELHWLKVGNRKCSKDLASGCRRWHVLFTESCEKQLKATKLTYRPQAWCIRYVLSSSAPLYHWSPGGHWGFLQAGEKTLAVTSFLLLGNELICFPCKVISWWSQASASGLDPRRRAWSSEDATHFCGTFSSPHPDAFLCHNCHIWRLMVEQLQSGLEGNILSRRLKEDQWHTQPWEDLRAGRLWVSRFICSWDSWAGKWVQLMDLKAHSNENHYHNDVVN